jgi:protein disulfide-isomerase A1
MNFTLFIALIVCIAASLAQEIEEGVLVLTDENFDKTIADTEFILVEFYAPWCGHCKSLAPEYAKAATKLASEGSEVKLAKVDATEHKTAAGKHDVKGFPTLKFFRSGSASDYEGGRTADEIVSWLSKKTGPAATAVATEEELQHMQEANDVFVIGVFDDESSAAAKTFMSVAGGDDAHTFAVTSAAAVKASLGVTTDSVIVIKTFDELRNEITVDGKSTSASISEFITAHASPLVQIFSDETSGKIFKSSIQKHALFFTNTGDASHVDVMKAFESAGKTLRGQAMMINVPHTQERVMEYFGLKGDDLPACVLADMSGSGMKKFPMSGSLTDAANVETFLKDALAGNVKATLKSEEPSPEDTAGDVTVLKGKSFQELVIDNDKDVLVKFYAPWCGHCKNIAPIWEELGTKLKDNENIVIAKMDSTANEIDVKGVDVKGFPTLMFFKGNDKKNPKSYGGGRTLDDFVSYLKDNAANDIGDLPEPVEDDEDDEEDESQGEL